MLKSNCYNYKKSELRKLKRSELLKVYYEQEKEYYESVSGCDKEWSKNHPFDNFIESCKLYTKEDILERLSRV